MLVGVVGVSFRDSVLLPLMRTGLVVLLWISMLWFLMEASVGGGQLLALVASTSISWSGRCVLTDRLSPGSRILLVFMDISLGCVVSGCVVTGGTWSLGGSPVGVAVLVLIVFVCCVAVWCVCGVATMQCRHAAVCGVVRCCVSGKSASLCVLGTVHLLPSREIWLWTKFCVMLLSLMKTVPPMIG